MNLDKINIRDIKRMLNLDEARLLQYIERFEQRIFFERGSLRSRFREALVREKILQDAVSSVLKGG